MWINATHILSVRNAGGGGSTVVILTAGPEHRVREDPQAVIELARAALAGPDRTLPLDCPVISRDFRALVAVSERPAEAGRPPSIGSTSQIMTIIFNHYTRTAERRARPGSEGAYPEAGGGRRRRLARRGGARATVAR